MSSLVSHPLFPRPGVLTPEIAAHVLEAATRTPAETAELLLAICQSTARASRELAAACLSHLERTGLLHAPEMRQALEVVKGSLELCPLGTLILAQYAERQKDNPEAARLLRSLEGAGISGGVSVSLDLVRVLQRMGASKEACAVLRRAAAGTKDFATLSRAAKQLARLKDHPKAVCSRVLKIGLLYPYTTDLWVPLLRLALFREGIWADFLVPPYGTQEQAILDPGSPLYSFAPEVVLLANTWRDLNLPAFSKEPTKVVQDRVQQVVSRWKHLQSRMPVRIIQHNFEVPAFDPNGYVGRVTPGGRAAIIHQINAELLEAAQAHHVTILDLDNLAADLGKRVWVDSGAWYTAKQYPAASALPTLVDGQVARIRAGLGLTKKVLVLDLDNTLWGGVIGEEGLNGIEVGPPSATGEAHLALQQYAAEFKERGILLAVCSKNNEEDAKAPFLKHEGMRLRLDDFVVFVANWQDKPTNIRNMAKGLNLGLDSFVFLDDNPIERALVRQEIPEIAVPEIGSDPSRFIEILDAADYFDVDQLSAEDLDRSVDYMKNVQREALRADSESLESFLKGLEMSCEHGEVADHVMARVVQLMGKTNQFNLTTRRYSEAQIRGIMANPLAWTHYFRLKDKFADNGLVGVMIAVPSSSNLGAWELDTWLMSCRVIGRKLEHFMMDALMAAARERGIKVVYGLYLPTAKNSMVANLFSEMGFTAVEASGQEGCIFRVDTPIGPIQQVEFIQDLSCTTKNSPTMDGGQK
jgi:FkbH-like protein